MNGWRTRGRGIGESARVQVLACVLAGLVALGCKGSTSTSGVQGSNDGAGSARGGSAGSSGAGRGGAGTGSAGAGRGGGGAVSGSGASSLGGRGGAGAGAGTAGSGTVGGGRGGNAAGSPGSLGGAGSDAGPSSGSTCADADYALCEDFESTEVGEVPDGWSQRGDAEVSGDQVHRGIRALRAAPAGTGQRRIVHSLAELGATSGTHWGRVHYRVKPQPTPTDRVIHATFVALHGDSPNHDDAIEVRVVDTVANVTGKHQFLFNVEPDGSRVEFGDGSSYEWELDGEWHCAEWRVDAGEQAYRFFIDEEEVTEIAQHNGPSNYNGTELPERFDTVAVGINNYQDAAFGGSPGYEMWLDDFAIDDERIGCIPD